MKKCADGCGRGCTEQEYDRAVHAADKLVEQLGEGWVPRVHENLGWFAGAISPSGTVKVSPSIGKGYIAFIGEAGFPGGKWAEHGDTPKGAVAAVVAVARAEVDKVTGWLEGV